MPSTTTITATAVSSKTRSRQSKEQGKVQVTKKSERVSSSISTKTPPTVVGQNPRDDFFWSYTEEPHRTRRQAIIKAHPEVSNDFRQPWNTACPKSSCPAAY
jgi:sphingolipid delta-4 desaturase